MTPMDDDDTDTANLLQPVSDDPSGVAQFSKMFVHYYLGTITIPQLFISILYSEFRSLFQRVHRKNEVALRLKTSALR